MKQVYYKPEMTVVAVNQQQPLLGTSSSSTGPNSDFMSNPTIGGGSSARENNGVWDNDWNY